MYPVRHTLRSGTAVCTWPEPVCPSTQSSSASKEGASPDRIVQSFPTLKLSQVYGAIAYYLENEKTVNEYLAEGKLEMESAAPLSRTNPKLFARLESARRQIGSKRT